MLDKIVYIIIFNFKYGSLFLKSIELKKNVILRVMLLFELYFEMKNDNNEKFGENLIMYFSFYY